MTDARINNKQFISGLMPFIQLIPLAYLLTLMGNFIRLFDSGSLFWPTNAILLGLLLRRFIYTHFSSWLAIYLGMVMASLSKGDNWQLALYANICNISLIATSYWIIRSSRACRHFDKPQAILYLFTASLLGASLAATLSLLFDLRLDDYSEMIRWEMWFGEQFSTTLLILPVMLTAPRIKQFLHKQFDWQFKECLPLLALAVSLLFGIIIGGPGAIAFTVPALLWCAMRYQLFSVTLLTLITGWVIISDTSIRLMQYEALSGHNLYVDMIMSTRLGVAILAIVPLMLSSAMLANDKLLKRLNHSATYDVLTGVLSRNAFMSKAAAVLAQKNKFNEAVVLLLIDIDHFKLLNDEHGSVVGDRVLAMFAHLLHTKLNQDQLLGRLGGEEFMIMMPRALAVQGFAFAEYLRQCVQAKNFNLQDKGAIHLTVSIGVASLAMNEIKSLEKLMNMADVALYRAKAQGYNCVESFNAINNNVDYIVFKE